MEALNNFREGATTSLLQAASKVGLGGKEEEAQDEETGGGVLDEISEMCPKLSYEQRITGFALCFGLGYLITFLSFGRFMSLVTGNALPFVALYTFGNVLSLLACMFLCGPKQQFKNMFDEKRRWTSIIYMSTLVLTIVVCYLRIDGFLKLPLLIILLLVQLAACAWYCLSYIPFGRKTALSCVQGMCGWGDSSQV